VGPVLSYPVNLGVTTIAATWISTAPMSQPGPEGRGGIRSSVVIPTPAWQEASGILSMSGLPVWGSRVGFRPCPRVRMLGCAGAPCHTPA
jgi:hypothetical protein